MQINTVILARNRRYIAVAAAYALISLALFLPLIGNATSTVVGANADIYQNLWNIWWTGYALLVAHVGIFSTTYLLFWPVGANLVFQTLSPISGLISLPMQAFGLPLAYNFLFFLGFVLTGLGGFVLTEYVTNDAHAAAFGGLAFTFSSFHIAQEWGHMAFFNVGLTALFIYLFIVTLENKKRSSALLAGVALFLILFMDGVEEGLIVSLAAVIIMVFYSASGDGRAKVLNRMMIERLSAIALPVVVLGLFWIIPLLGTALTSGLSAANNLNNLQTNMLWSADLLSFFLPSFFNGMFHGAAASYYSLIYGPGGPQDRIVYIGYTLIALAAYGVYKDKKTSKLWLVMLASFMLLSMGPLLQIGSKVLPVPLPYYLLHFVPLFNVIREPGRFYLIASMCFAVLSGVGVKHLLERISGTSIKARKLALLSIISLAFILESAGIPMLLPRQQFTITPHIPEYIRSLNSLQGTFSFISLPALPQRSDPALYLGIATYYTTTLRRPLVGGYLTRTTPLNNRSLYSIPFVVASSELDFTGNFTYLSPIQENYTLQSLKTLNDYGTRFVILQDLAYNQSELRELGNYLESVFGKPAYSDANITVFDTAEALAGAHLYEDGNFISYFQPQSWYHIAQPYMPVAGWVPLDRYGMLAVYAPYPASGTESQGSINATMSFSAYSLVNQTLSIISRQNLPDTTPASSYLTITPGKNSYSVDMSLLPGHAGNLVAFVSEMLFDGNNATASVLINNVTFRYANASRG